MGWFSISKTGEILREETHGRPVQAGEDGELQAIGQEDYGHSVLVDLINGTIFLDFEQIGWQNGTIEIVNFRTMFEICDETNVVGELVDVRRGRGRATKEGVIKQTITPVTWRPIWFTRHGNTLPAPMKIVGAQATLPKAYSKGKNIKKLITLFPDGRIGID